MADVACSELESRHGPGTVKIFYDCSDFQLVTKEAIAKHSLCEKCKGPIIAETLRCALNHKDGIWIPDEASYEAIEVALQYEKRRSKNQMRSIRRMDALGQIPGFYRPSDIDALFKAQNGECYYCDSALGKDFRKDHMEPLASARSSNWPSNIALACYTCNRDKSGSSFNAYWKEVEKQRGKRWTASKKEKNTPAVELGRSLTKIRKKELSELGVQLNERLRELLRNANRDATEYIRAELHKGGMTLILNDVQVELPPGSHWRMTRKNWTTREAPRLFDALTALQQSFKN